MHLPLRVKSWVKVKITVKKHDINFGAQCVAQKKKIHQGKIHENYVI